MHCSYLNAFLRLSKKLPSVSVNPKVGSSVQNWALKVRLYSLVFETFSFSSGKEEFEDFWESLMRTIFNDKKNRAKKVSFCEKEDVKHHKRQNLKYFWKLLN